MPLNSSAEELFAWLPAGALKCAVKCAADIADEGAAGLGDPEVVATQFQNTVTAHPGKGLRKRWILKGVHLLEEHTSAARNVEDTGLDMQVFAGLNMAFENSKVAGADRL